MNRPTITAHSGSDGTRDGSMESIQSGIELGADLIEVDVRRVSGVLALTHDQPDGLSGLVTLERAFREIAGHGRIGVNCDLKHRGLAREVIELAAVCGLGEGQLAMSGSLTPGELRADPGIAAAARVYLNIEEALAGLIAAESPDRPESPWDLVQAHSDRLEALLPRLIESISGLGIRALNLPPKRMPPALLSALGGAGVRLSVWTVNEEPDMRALLALPWVDNLTTRRVALATRVRRETLGEV